MSQIIINIFYCINSEIFPTSVWFHSAAVSTSALHAEGPGFDPQWNQQWRAFLPLPSRRQTVGFFCFKLRRNNWRFSPILSLGDPLPHTLLAQIVTKNSPVISALPDTELWRNRFQKSLRARVTNHLPTWRVWEPKPRNSTSAKTQIPTKVAAATTE